MNGSSAQTGKAGERMTVEWLRTQGFYICERNWRAGRYEIDIIAMRWDTVHFVEVKTRRSGGWVSPHTAVDASKIRAFFPPAAAGGPPCGRCLGGPCVSDINTIT